jgi:hypothetical protein
MLMRKFLKAFGFVLVIALLTLLTQVGGIILLIAFGIAKLPVVSRINKFRTIITFLVLYTFSSFSIVPMVAGWFGREPLYVFNQTLRPLTIMTCILNRHYVRAELKKAMLAVSQRMGKQHPGTILYYLDGSFPFVDRYPLLPHLSHNDGKKLDICFFYKNVNGEQLTGHPSSIGYGVYEGPKSTETDMPAYCGSLGYWQYGVLEKIISQRKKKDFLFDSDRTKSLISHLVHDKDIRSIYIEPHLKERLQLDHPKVKFHGCIAVRHDDHIHVNLD